MDYIVQVNPVDFANGLFVECKRGVKDDFKIFAQTNRKMELLFDAMENTIGGADLGKEENKKFTFWVSLRCTNGDTKQVVVTKLKEFVLPAHIRAKEDMDRS